MSKKILSKYVLFAAYAAKNSYDMIGSAFMSALSKQSFVIVNPISLLGLHKIHCIFIGL